MSEEVVSEYLKERRALIVDSSTSRNSIRRLLSQLGIKPADIDVVESWDDAVAIMERNRPQIVFTEYAIGSRSGLELVPMVRKCHPNSLEFCFFVLSDVNSETLGSTVADADADALFIRPFTYGDLQNRLIEVVVAKARPAPFARYLQHGNVLAAEGDFEGALEQFRAARKADPNEASICSSEGKVFVQMKKMPEARESFEAGLRIQPTHYKCLSGLLDLLMASREREKAYEVAQILTQNHPVPARLIPDLVRLSVVNHKYEDVLNWHEIFEKIGSSEDQLVKYVSAGLVVCGKYLIRKNDVVRAVSALKQAAIVSKQKPVILAEILSTLIKAELLTEADAVLRSMSDELKKKDEFVVLEYRLTSLTKPVLDTLHLGLTLIRDGIKAAEVFEVVISCAHAIGKKEDWIEPYLSEAVRLFPDRKQHFEDLLKAPIEALTEDTDQ